MSDTANHVQSDNFAEILQMSQAIKDVFAGGVPYHAVFCEPRGAKDVLRRGRLVCAVVEQVRLSDPVFGLQVDEFGQGAVMPGIVVGPVCFQWPSIAGPGRLSDV